MSKGNMTQSPKPAPTVVKQAKTTVLVKCKKCGTMNPERQICINCGCLN